MRVAYVHTGLWPSRSPSTTFATSTAAALAEVCGGCLFLIRRNHSGPAEAELAGRLGMECPKGLEIRSLRRLVPFSSRPYLRRAARELRRARRRGELDAVVSRSTSFLPHLARMRRELGIPVLYESHDFYADLSIRDDAGGGAPRRRRLELRYLPRVSALLCLQRSQMELYRRVFPGLRMEVARTGFRRFVRETGNRRLVTYVGSLDPHKGLEVLLRAVRASKTRPPLLLAGGKDTDAVRGARRMARRLAPDVDVEVSGWMDRPELERRLAETAIGVLPLEDTFFNRYLTSPLKLFDYYSHGIPVIASDLPTLRELVEEDRTGVFFPPGDSGALAGEIDALWRDGERRERLSANIFEECGRFLWTRRAEGIRDLILELGRS